MKGAAALLLLASLLLVGCGSGGGASSSTATGASSTVSVQKPPKPGAPRQGAAQFRTRGGDNSIQEFGTEADESELRAAAVVLHDLLAARAAGRWARACSDLSASFKRSLTQLASRSRQAQGGGCAAALKALSAGVPPTALAEATIADAGALRREGARGFLLYYGAHHTPYGIPVAREGGSWRVGAIVGVPLG